MSSLAHHGVKGQKWGVRRYQNPDGTRTDRGKKQDKLRRLRKNTSEDFISIRKTLSDDDLRMLNYSDKAIKYMRKNGSLNNDPITSGTAHRVIQKDKNGTPVTYVEATGFTSNSLLTGKETVRIISIDLATRSGEEYRGKGHAVAAGKKMVRWFDRYGYKEYEYMEWAAKEKNIASQKTAEKLGFNKLDISEPGWTLYAYTKHSSIGGNMNYIYGNTLVLGDSSYLEHHGIKNQKWGIRRFQNPDGSLTAAGRIRYGVTGAAKAAFKVGKKLGSATASAARAGVNKAKDNAYEKKKEKASQTREGVLKNKKMFTNEELKRLEERFKIEDDMRNAGLRHGQEIAKTISAYGDAAVKTMNALQTGGKAVKAISDGLSALQDYKEKRDIGKKASDAGMSTADYKEYTKAKTSEKTSNKPPNDDNPPNDGGGAGSKKQAQAKAEAETKAKADKEEAEERKALDKVNRIKASQPEPSATSEEGVKTVIKNSVAGTNKETRNSIRSAIQSIIKSSSGSKSGLDKLKKMAKDHAEDVKDSPDVDAVNNAYLKKLQSLLNNIKHSDMDELAHFGVKGMKWGKHLMAGKGSSTDISSGGGGGAPEEDDETIADILGIDVDTYRQKINEGPFGYGQYADQLGEKAEKLHAQAEANRKMADQVGLTGNKKKAAEFRKKSEQLKKDAVKAEKLKTYMNRRANGESALGITADTVNTTIVKPITGLTKDISRSVSASNPMNSDLVRKLRRVKHGSMDSFMIENGILRYGFDESDYLEHHGIKGQRWGVRRFQNADGSLTDKGRKHYQKKLALEERKLTAANAARGQYERVRTPMSVGMGILGAVAGAMVGVPAGPAGIAAGAAIVSSIAASSNYAAYTVAGIVAGQGAKSNMKKIAKYKEALAQDAFEIQNGVLIYGSGQSEELKHFGIKGMKWGVRRFQNKDGTRTAAGKKREKDYAAKNNSAREKFYYTDGTVRKGASAYVYKRGPGVSSKYVGSERVGSTRKQAKAEAAAEALLFDKGRHGKTLSDRDRKRLQRDVRKGDEELLQIKTLASATEHKNLHDLERYKKAGNRLSAKAVEKRLVRDRQYFEKADASDLQTEKNIYHGHRYAAAIALGIGSGLASSGVLPAAAASVAVGASIVTALSSAATIDLHTSAHRDVRLKNGMDKMDSTRQRDKLRERQEKEAERERKKQLRSKR